MENFFTLLALQNIRINTHMEWQTTTEKLSPQAAGLEILDVVLKLN